MQPPEERLDPARRSLNRSVPAAAGRATTPAVLHVERRLGQDFEVGSAVAAVSVLPARPCRSIRAASAGRAPDTLGQIEQRRPRGLGAGEVGHDPGGRVPTTAPAAGRSRPLRRGLLATPAPLRRKLHRQLVPRRGLGLVVHGEVGRGAETPRHLGPRVAAPVADGLAGDETELRPRFAFRRTDRPWQGLQHRHEPVDHVQAQAVEGRAVDHRRARPRFVRRAAVLLAVPAPGALDSRFADRLPHRGELQPQLTETGFGGAGIVREVVEQTAVAAQGEVVALLRLEPRRVAPQLVRGPCRRAKAREAGQRQTESSPPQPHGCLPVPRRQECCPTQQCVNQVAARGLPAAFWNCSLS